ncbi:hypothetical protein [Paraburkholderia sp. UYCP14C]|uniref:hypothetical protein n=1 Tax=Paraburkholderia sp. UYCP14C TaxID=2511130 RepID=UPI00359FD0B0
MRTLARGRSNGRWASRRPDARGAHRASRGCRRGRPLSDTIARTDFTNAFPRRSMRRTVRASRCCLGPCRSICRCPITATR